MMSVFYFFHGIGKTLEGTVRGFGKHSYCTKVVIIAFYCVSLPIIVNKLKNPEVELYEIWMGPSVGAMAEVVLYTALLIWWFDYE